MSLVDHAACLMAGSIALRRAGLGHLGRGQGHDETRLNELVRMSGRGEVFRERARARAELLVDSNFPAIRRVADALAHKDSLSVEEFQQLIYKLKEIGVLVGELSTDEQNSETKVAQAENTEDDANSLKSASKKLKDKQEKDGRSNISCKNGHQVGQYRVRGDGRLEVWRYGNNWNRVYVRSASSVAAGRRMLAGGCNCR
jgi:hypothetical protein